MYWSGLRLSSEVILGTVHCVLRARRVDFSGTPTWDDLWRGTLNPPGDMRDEDMPWYVMVSLAKDLPPLTQGNGPS